MKLEEQEIAIAKACGAKWHWTQDKRAQFLTLKEWDGDVVGENEEISATRFLSTSLPDYLNDLNAMHEAEKTMNGSNTWGTYVANLKEIMDDDWAEYACAPANVRAEAFLKTIGKWDDGET